MRTLPGARNQAVELTHLGRFSWACALGCRCHECHSRPEPSRRGHPSHPYRMMLSHLSGVTLWEPSRTTHSLLRMAVDASHDCEASTAMRLEGLSVKPLHTSIVLGSMAIGDIMSGSELEAVRPGLQVGPTSEFSLFFEIKAGHADDLRQALLDLQDTPGYRPGEYQMALATIHEARFVLFDDDKRLAFITSFDGPWDAYMEDFFTSGPTLELFNVIFQHVEGYEGLPDLQTLKAFILGAEEPAAVYQRNYGGTVKEIRKALRVNDAFQRVLDDPSAGEALQHPALKPLLDEAGD